MTDRELLELAAKAAGYDYKPLNGVIVEDGIPGNWNPLTDDGDAMRLAADVLGVIEFVIDEWPDEEAGVMRRKVNTPATRRAIVRAAASIGKGMQ